jgi:hypothetical protein
MDGDGSRGVAAAELADADLERELANLHRMRHETFLHGGWSALHTHTGRTVDLEEEYLRRHPQREIDLQRTREGARRRQARPTGGR